MYSTVLRHAKAVNTTFTAIGTIGTIGTVTTITNQDLTVIIVYGASFG